MSRETFEKFANSVRIKNLKNICPGDNICTYLCCKNLKSQSERDHSFYKCDICSEILDFVLKFGAPSFSCDSPFEIGKKKYIIRKCLSKEDALARVEISDQSGSFVRVLFAFSCSNSFFVLQIFKQKADSVKKLGTEIRKSLSELSSDFSTRALLPQHVRVREMRERKDSDGNIIQTSRDPVFLYDPEPFVKHFLEFGRKNPRKDEEPFLSLLFSYINQNVESIDLIGIYLREERDIQRIKKEFQETGKISRTSKDYLNLVKIN